MNDNEIRDLLRGMRDEPVPADSMVRVRMAVAERVQRRFPIWKIAAALLAVGCLALVAVLVRTDAPVPSPMQAKQEVPHELAVQQPIIPPTPEHHTLHSVRRVIRPHAEPVLPVAPPAKDGDVLIRIETPDPEVVILLVGE